MRFFFAGQNNFGNRGCEALIRSITGIINSYTDGSTYFCPSHLGLLDHQQWQDANKAGVQFVHAPPFSNRLKWWARVSKVIPLIESFYRPEFAVDLTSQQLIQQSDAVIMTGGDILTLDYGVASLYYWANLVDRAIDSGKPAILWAGSVGPFNAKPYVEREMVKHLQRYAAITVRESVSYEYLHSLGIKHVKLVADPAFTLEPEAFDISKLTFGHNPNILGLNVSPLIRGYRQQQASRQQLDNDVIDFIRDVTSSTNFSILLLPHVDPLDGSPVNSDSSYMQGLLSQLPAECQTRVNLAPRNLNAAQLKYLLSYCRLFIGARTHATIGALSMGVPTISIAYSIKAKGINKDLFGHTKFVLETPLVSRKTLNDAFSLLLQEEFAIKELLKHRIPAVRAQAYQSIEMLASC